MGKRVSWGVGVGGVCYARGRGWAGGGEPPLIKRERGPALRGVGLGLIDFGAFVGILNSRI